jgi:hypothetical protein
MDNTIRSYRGFEIYPLVYPRKPRTAGGTYDYEAGFDAAVKICRRDGDNGITTSRIFHVSGVIPFGGAGEARRASASFAEQLIDGKIEGQSIAELLADAASASRNTDEAPSAAIAG